MQNRSTWISLFLLIVIAIGGAVYLTHQSGEKAGILKLSYDEAGLMTEQERERLDKFHTYLLKDHDIDYRVETGRGLGDINLYAANRFRELVVGGLSNSGRGLLLVIDPEQDRVRMEVSHSLEAVYIDAFVAYIEQRQMVPFFRAGRVADGILATTEMIVARAQNAETNSGFSEEVWNAASTGAGAATRAELNQKADFSFQDGADVIAGSPEETLAAYTRAMANRNLRPDLAIYTQKTREMLADWVMTPAQADNQAKTLGTCRPQPVKYDSNDRLAVIRYAIKERKCNPWFFHLEDGAWRLDLTQMQKIIRFGRSNAWHFDLSTSHPYGFAFNDWGFDKNGYPTQRYRWVLSVGTYEEVGTVVTRVGRLSPAEQMGLQVGDRILRWGGKDITSHRQVLQAMTSVSEGELVTALIERNGEKIELNTLAPEK